MKMMKGLLTLQRLQNDLQSLFSSQVYIKKISIKKKG